MSALPCRSKSNIVEMLDPINNSNCFTTPKTILFGKPFHPNDFAFSFYFKTKKSMRISTSKTNVVLRPQKLIMKRLLGIPLCVVLMFLSLGLNAQDIQVKGRVVDTSNNPVPRATVKVKGSKTAVAADENGAFQVAAPQNGTLVISSVGFLEQEVKISNRTEISVTMANGVASTDEVVVIGYGSQRKKDVTGSTVSVKGETLNEIKAPNIFNQLQGRAAGVDIVNNSTQIGSAGDIKIRGNRSLTAITTHWLLWTEWPTGEVSMILTRMISQGLTS